MSATEPPPATPRPRRWGRRLAIIILTPYLIVLIVLYALQTMLIFPGAATQGSAEARFQDPPGAERVMLAADGEKITALFGPALASDGQPHPDAAARPTILFFYGNGMCLANMVEEFERFRRLGANVLIPEFLGYGLSEGKPSEAGCYATASAAYDWLAHNPRVDPKKILLGGWSLGSAVAIDLAAKHPPAGLLVWSGFTSIVDIAKQQYFFLPVSALLKHRFENLGKIARVEAPVIIAHGRQDELVPFEMSDRVAAACKSPVTRLSFDGVGHNDLMISGGKALFQATGALVEQVAALTSEPVQNVDH